MLNNDPSNPAYYKFSYEYQIYPKGEWATTGQQLSHNLFPTCDVIIGQGHGCSDSDIQAQAAVAHQHQRLYFTLRGPRAVLSDPQDPSKRLSPYMFSTHIRSDFYAHAMLRKFVQRSREIDANTGGEKDRPIDIAFLNFAHNAFFDGVAEQAIAYATDASNGYNIVYSAKLKDKVCEEKDASSGNTVFGANGAAGCTPLSQYIDDITAAQPEVLLVSSNGGSFKPVLKMLSDQRPRVEAGSVRVRSQALKGLFWVGVPWLSGGKPSCAGLGSHCAHAIGATQISKEEADTFADKLLVASRVPATYDWLRANDTALAAAYVANITKAEADAAVIPSIIAQAMQKTFHFRQPASRATPLRAKGSSDYEALRAFLASGEQVAQTYYGPVAFDEFGNNKGREATAFQMSEATAAAEVVYPSTVESAVTLRYYAPAYDDARLGLSAYDLDYGPACDSMADPLQPCGAANGGPACLLCSPVTYETDAPTSFPWGVVLPVGICVTLFLLALVAGTAVYARRKAAALQDAQVKRVVNAVLSTTVLRHSAALVPAQTFEKMGRLICYEELRDSHRLRYCDDLDALLKLADEGYSIIFISHQWTSYTKPDPSNKQYLAMVAGVQKVAREMGWSMDKTLVWVDYSSIPQANPAEQGEAINALPAYVSAASVLLIVAPTIEHADTHAICDLQTYRGRMWVRLEHLGFAMTNSTNNMWLATGEDPTEVGPVVQDTKWLEDNLRVFEAAATVENDKFHIVDPVLGLYAQMLLNAHRAGWRRGTMVGTGGATADGNTSNSGPLLAQQKLFFTLIGDKERPLFPPMVTVRTEFKDGQRFAIKNPKPQVLFGNLPEVVRQIVGAQLATTDRALPMVKDGGISTAFERLEQIATRRDATQRKTAKKAMVVHPYTGTGTGE